MINLTLLLGSSLHGCLCLLGQEAAKAGRPDIEAECLAVASKTGDTNVQFRVTAADLMCVAADRMRELNKPEAVQAIEDLVRALKADAPKRIVAGSMNFNHVTSVGQLDDTLELVRRQVIRSAGG